MEKKISEFKPKGEYPLDEEGTLYVSPYWKKAMMLKEEKEQKGIHMVDVFIGAVILSFLSFFLIRLFS